MRNGILLLSFVGIATVCGIARAEIFEVPLPVTGTYQVRDRRAFEVDFGTEFSEIREIRFRVEGTMVAPLRGLFNPPTTPINGFFQAQLISPNNLAVAAGPPVGLATYPEPEPFAGEDAFGHVNGTDWSFLLDGKASGQVIMAHSHLPANQTVAGGLGTITSATLFIDATPVPEPGLLSCIALSVWGLLRKPRHLRK